MIYEAWVKWLLAQPFRYAKVRDADKNAFMGNVEDRFNAAWLEIKYTVASDNIGTLG